MLIKVKSINQRQEDFEVLDLEQLVSDFAKQVCEKFNYVNGVKLIYTGRILVNTEKLSKYFSETFTVYIVCMEEKKKQEAQQQNTSINIANNQVPQPQVTQTPQTQQVSNTMLEHDRALIYTFLRMFSSIRMFNYLYFTSPEELIRLIRVGDFDDLIQQISSQTEQINNSIINNQNTMLDVTINDGLHESLLNNIMNPTGTTGTGTTGTGTTGTTGTTCNNITRGPPEIVSEDSEESEEIQQVLPQLSEEDKANIQTLISFGYGEQEAIFAYIMSNKNLDAAANILMDM